MKRLSNVQSDRQRKIARTIFFAVLGAGILANVVLLYERPASTSDKPPAFRLSQPLYPICYTKADGFVVMRMANPGIIRRLAQTLPDTRWRNRNRTAYVSRSYWQNEKDAIWNMTRSLVEYMHYKRTGERVTDANWSKLKTNSCLFIRKYASQ